MPRKDDTPVRTGFIQERLEKTEREEALRQSEQRYRALFEESRDAIVITERDGVIVDANIAASELFAYPRSDLIGQNIRQVYVNPSDRSRFQEEVEIEGFVRDFEVKYRTRDGREIDCLVTTTVRRASDGTVIGYQGITRDITDRKRMEKQLRDHHRELRSLAAQLAVSEDRERRRIAADLHDRIGQTLAVSQLKIEALRHAAEGDRDTLMADLHDLIDQMDNDVRSLTFDLSPPVLYELGLVPGLQWLSEQINGQHGLEVTVTTEGDCEVLDEDLRVSLFRCIRELLVNVARHADTSAASVLLQRDKTQLHVVVADEGIGFDNRNLSPAEDRSGFGLFSVQERMTHAGGSLEIESATGKGTRCALMIPSAAFAQENRQR